MNAGDATQISIAVVLTITLAVVFCYARQARRQVEELRKGLRSSVYASGATHMFTVDEIFVQYPEMRAYFYEHEEIDASNVNYRRATAIAELLLDYFQSAFQHMEDFPKEWPRDGWEEYIKYVFAHSPVLCQYLDSVRGWYTEKLIELWETAQTSSD